MKIRKFNESLDDSLIEYIEECFVEFLDNNSEVVKAENPNSKGSYYYIVNIKLDVEEKNNTTSFIEENEISSLVDYHTYLSSTLNDVNDSISKLRIRYDNTALVVRITTGYDYINCYINPKKTT
jgi:hypothetical protein